MLPILALAMVLLALYSHFISTEFHEFKFILLDPVICGPTWTWRPFTTLFTTTWLLMA